MVETASLGSGSTGSGGGNVGDASGGDASSGGGGIPSGLPFQVGYREAGQEYTLYLLAAREQDRAEWIRAIRAGKSFYYFLFFLFYCFFFSVTLIFIAGSYKYCARTSFLRHKKCVLSLLFVIFILISYDIR